ncbi:hypothetical protein LTR62_001302 [Meristemomyces frigidus]|uniref:Autophagy-related protein 11 n=1 Tax=Meristemomyces frigidus TaxID=1508187 RepID=A0AAN7TG45_9PEZI|nr:hypothetical protein LTR62_001302 [Meristemomyces frigidus]
MSVEVQVYIGHTGQRLSIDPSVTNTLETLRSWIAKQAAVPARRQILLTAQGKQVRTASLLAEAEIFVFDSGRLNSNVGSPSSSGAKSSLYHDYNPGPPPEGNAPHDDLSSWQNLLKARRKWANELLKGCDNKAKQAERYQDEQAIMERSVAVAVASLYYHIQTAEQKQLASEQWAEELLQEQHIHMVNWEQHLGSLRSIPARSEFARFVQPTSPAARQMSHQAGVATLQTFVDVAATKKAAGAAKALMAALSDTVGKMREDMANITRQSEGLHQAVEQMSERSSTHSTSEPAQLLEEIQLVVKKISSDLQHLQTLPDAAPSVSQASKMAQLHTRNFLPALAEHCAEMNELVRRTQRLRDSAAQICQEHMHTLSLCESQLAEHYSEAKNLEMPEDDQQVFANLAIISRLPSVYGQLLVESVRRREWVAKMKRDSITLQEEVATYQEEEDKRRKKWIRSVEDVVSLDALQANVLGIELSLQNEGGSWPMVTRDELDEYTKTLVEVFGEGPVTTELDQAIKDLDKPTRKQIKHARAFKNGSMHEAAFGDTSLLLRGDEQYKILRESNTRLEDDLRAQKSRVRKLEDLLHRQMQPGRASNGDLFSPQNESSERITSPLIPTPQHSIDETSGVHSLRQRRPSSTQAIEEKKLARRVVDLESELQAFKNEAAARETFEIEAQRQVEEAVSTKKDLMENMEAQQREFADERRNLERELSEGKERLEELENEVDRLIGSRDDERTGIDARVTNLQDEIAQLKEEAMGRAASEHDARVVMEQTLESAKLAKVEAEAELQKLRHEREEKQEAEVEALQLLTAAHNHLTTDGEAPSTFTSVASALEDLAQRSAAHVRDLADAVAFAKAENQSLWASNERQKKELSKAAEQHIGDEESVRQAQEAHAAESAKVQSLEQQLGDEQEQLRVLREKFAEGETGSGALRERIADEEAKANKLSSELAEAKSHVTSLDVELMKVQKKHRAYHASAEAATTRLEKRAERAKDISHQLYTQNARLSRLLEQLGLALSYKEDGTMLIERASKIAASTLMSDIGEPKPGLPSRAMTMTLTSPPPTRKSSTSEDVVDVSLVHWADAQTPEEESARFEAFAAQITRFNIDYLSDQIHKRLRDYEYTAKKYNKEWRESAKRADAYKERSVKLKNESHAKVAVKDFKEGDLALFLPTRGQAKGAWAAFNVNCPHYFLAEKDGMRLGNRDFIIVRITKVEQKVVDLGRSLQAQADGKSIDEAASLAASSFDDDNPFDLSDGLTWWLVHAIEERGAGMAPSTPGLGKSTVAAANVDAKGSIRSKRGSKGEDASRVLNKSLDSRRSSSGSKKGVLQMSGNTSTSPLAVEMPPPPPPAHALVSRSESEGSLRSPPTQANSGLSTMGGGRGDKSDVQSEARREDEQRPPPLILQPQPPSRSRSPANLTPDLNRARSPSPSKSIRSLQRHLQEQPSRSPANPSPTKSPAKKAGWESLWQAEVKVESPSKGQK